MSDRIFVTASFRVHHRVAPQVSWTSDADANYTLLLLLNGEVNFSLQSEPVKGVAGSLLMLAPGETARMQGRQLEYLTVVLTPTFLIDCAMRSRFSVAHGHIAFTQPLARMSAPLQRIAADLAEEMQGAAYGKDAVIAALLEQMMIHLLRNFIKVQRSDYLELSRAGLVDRRVRRAVELMQTQMERELSLSEIAAAAYLSPFHFARLFKKLMGTSPHSYLAALRINRAQLLLADPNLSITEVSARVGYASSSHFTRAFRNATGLTPRAYRSAVI
jgi:AraC family transcriptional regulator